MKTKEITVQIKSRKGSDKRLVKLFAHDLVRDIIESLSNGNIVEEFFKKGDAKVASTVCSKLFLKQATLKLHTKSHKMCNKCGKGHPVTECGAGKTKT